VSAEATPWLWLGVVAIGAFHGLNPAMGWPLAVASGLTHKRDAAVFATFVPLGVGHLLAMLLVLAPLTMLLWLQTWQREIRLSAGGLVILFGLVLWVRRGHPRWLARVRPSQVMLWSLLMATAHGAALMLLPILLQLCRAPATASISATPISAFDHEAMMGLMRSNLMTAVLVSLLHSAAMIVSGLAVAWGVYRHLGLRALRSAWLNLDRVWSLSLVAAGAAAVAMAWLSAPVAGM
jgi:hypothetical protein